VVNETTKRLMARVKQIRLAKELSQEKFAEQAGIDYKYYQHVEAGRRPNPELVTLLKLAKGTGLELWQLLKFDDVPSTVAEDPGKYAGKTSARKSRKPAHAR
jgi:transcriptional regulator with XRE-family HTH domain